MAVPSTPVTISTTGVRRRINCGARIAAASAAGGRQLRAARVSFTWNGRGPVPLVADRRERGRRYADPLELVEVEPRASATIDLITSAWLQASQTAPGPRRAFQSRTASRARPWTSRSASQLGNVTADGCDWTVFQSGSRASALSSWPVQSPYRASPSRSSIVACWGAPSTVRPARIGTTVSRQRSSGDVTTAVSGTGRNLSASCAAWLRSPALVQVESGQPAGEDRSRQARRPVNEENRRHGACIGVSPASGEGSCAAACPCCPGRSGARRCFGIHQRRK